MRKALLVIALAIFLVPAVFAVDATQNVTVTIIDDPGKIVINEFVADPETDWNNDSSINSNDEWIELFNADNKTINLTDWTISDAVDSTETLSGILGPGQFLIILDPTPTINNAGDQLTLRDQYGRIVDSVSYGNYNDGNLFDNAPTGNSNNFQDECLARYPNGIDTGVDKDDFMKTKCTFNSTNNIAGNITVHPILISNTTSEPICLLETSTLTVSAFINGSIENVSLALNTDGTWKNISLPGNLAGFYTYKINESKITGGTNVSWQFIVHDIIGDITLGPLQSQKANSRTLLTIDPPNPNGLNGWYTTQPELTLTNPDAQTIFYRWDSSFELNSTGPVTFGLEDTPNNGNVTAGVLDINYWADICDEPESFKILYVDLTDPLIKNLYPAPGATIFNNSRPTIFAYLDEVHQSNSGIDKSTVIMFLDGSQVPANVSNADTIDATVSYTPPSDLPNGIYNVTVEATDKSGRTSQLSWSFEINTSGDDLSLTVSSPQDMTYNTKRVPFNVSTSREVSEIEYINHNDRRPRFRALCRNCDSYGSERSRTKTLNEGENNLTIRATTEHGTRAEKNITLFIDSKDPRISRTEPTRGFSNGIFRVEFREDNPVHLFLTYGNTSTKKNMEVNLSSCRKDRNDMICDVPADLTDFNLQEIEYRFNITDVAGNYDESRPRNVNVDLSPPILNKFNFTLDGRRATFYFNITEQNFEEITYIDHLERRPRERRLCSRLDEGICEKKKSFSRGEHNLSLTAYDEAGNYLNLSDVSFVI